MAGLSQPVSLYDIYNHEKSAAMLARQAPWWEPGTAAGYTTSPSGTWSASWYAAPPAGLSASSSPKRSPILDAEFHIGTGQEHDGRVSLLIQGSPDDPTGNEFFVRALLNPRVTHRRPGASRGAAPSWAG